jgi:hypothetical protein
MWVKNYVMYLFGTNQDVLIDKINDDQNNISPEVKHDLIKSIVHNDPTHFVEQISDENNHISENVKKDLLSYVRTPSPDEPLDDIWKTIFDLVLKQLKFTCRVKNGIKKIRSLKENME